MSIKQIYDFTELWFYQTTLFWIAGNRGVASLPPKWSKLGVPAAHLSNSCVKNSRKTQYGLQTFNLWRHWWPERYGDTTPLFDFSSGIDDNAELWFCRIRFFAPPSADLMIMLDDDIAEWKLYLSPMSRVCSPRDRSGSYKGASRLAVLSQRLSTSQIFQKEERVLRYHIQSRKLSRTSRKRFFAT